MKLIEMTISNFGSYKDSASFRFKDDITIYQGPNGAGKSTMIEAIFYAFYGVLAKEKVKDIDYVSLDKKGEISLTWEYQGEKYNIERCVTNISGKARRSRILKNLENGKEWKKDGTIQEIIDPMLGSLTTFKNSIYSPQGQLHSLLKLDGEDLKLELSRIFGMEQYKRLALTWERLSDRATKEKDNLRVDIKILRNKYDQLDSIKKLIRDLNSEDKTLEKKLIDIAQYLKSLEEIQDQKTRYETQITGFSDSIAEKKLIFDENKEKLTRIEKFISVEQLENIEKILNSLKTELVNIIKRIQILDPFNSEAGKIFNEINTEREIFSERDRKLESGIKKLINKSKDKNSPYEFEEEDQNEFISNNILILSSKIEELNETDSILEQLNGVIDNIKDEKRIDYISSLTNFLQNLKFIVPHDFPLDKTRKINEKEIILWIDELRVETEKLLIREQELNTNIITLKAKLKDLQLKLKEEKITLVNLQSGKIKTCTNCGTELTPKLRKLNEERLLDEIKELNYQIDISTLNLSSFDKEMMNSSFKNKLHILKTSNLALEIPERLKDFLSSFKKFVISSRKLEELEEEKNELKSNLPEGWKSYLDKSNIDKTCDHLKRTNQVYSSYLSDLDQLKESLSEKRQKDNEITELEKQLGDAYRKFGLNRNQPYETLKEELEDLKNKKIKTEETIDNLNDFQDLREKVDEGETEIKKLETIKKAKQDELKNPPFDTFEKDKSDQEKDRTDTNDRRRELSSEITSQKRNLEEAESAGEDKKVKEIRVRKLTKFEALSTSVSTVFRELRPKILNYKTKKIVDRTNSIIQTMPSQADTLRLGVEEIGEEYNLVVFRNGEKGKLHTVSGGELTGLGFALRVAIAQELSNLGILILDEPTYGLDKSRRSKLAEILVTQDYIKQLLVVTHDEIFKGKAKKIIQIRQNNGVSRNMDDELGIQIWEIDDLD